MNTIVTTFVGVKPARQPPHHVLPDSSCVVLRDRAGGLAAEIDRVRVGEERGDWRRSAREPGSHQCTEPADGMNG